MFNDCPINTYKTYLNNEIHGLFIVISKVKLTAVYLASLGRASLTLTASLTECSVSTLCLMNLVPTTLETIEKKIIYINCCAQKNL